MAFSFRLEKENGTAADPPVLHTAVPNWERLATRSLSALTRTLRVIATRFVDEAKAPVLVVEPA